MNKRAIILLISIVALLLLLFAAVILPSKYQHHQVLKQIMQADLTSTVKMCRWMITNRDKFKDEPCGIWNVSGEICINANSRQWSNSVPDLVKNLAPAHFIVISTNRLLIYVDTTPRTILLAFAEGAEQSGREKIADGLWIWNGTKTGN
jgi:hypothetical protein